MWVKNLLCATVFTVFSLWVVPDGAAAPNPETQPLPDAPGATVQPPQTQEPAVTPNLANPIQGSVQVFRLLERKSLVFPDLATNQGPLTSWQKFELAANNSVAL